MWPGIALKLPFQSLQPYSLPSQCIGNHTASNPGPLVSTQCTLTTLLVSSEVRRPLHSAYATSCSNHTTQSSYERPDHNPGHNPSYNMPSSLVILSKICLSAYQPLEKIPTRHFGQLPHPLAALICPWTRLGLPVMGLVSLRAQMLKTILILIGMTSDLDQTPTNTMHIICSKFDLRLGSYKEATASHTMFTLP